MLLVTVQGEDLLPVSDWLTFDLVLYSWVEVQEGFDLHEEGVHVQDIKLTRFFYFLGFFSYYLQDQAIGKKRVG